jgi:hypothetical protein
MPTADSNTPSCGYQKISMDDHARVLTFLYILLMLMWLFIMLIRFWDMMFEVEERLTE